MLVPVWQMMQRLQRRVQAKDNSTVLLMSRVYKKTLATD
ncbi:hypothetical protein A2U01_0043806, partial [Trifolium medium]|nr:hypothetical protein [Trifolium medium]